MEEQVLKPIQDPNEMDMSLSEAAARVSLTPEEISARLPALSAPFSPATPASTGL